MMFRLIRRFFNPAVSRSFLGIFIGGLLAVDGGLEVLKKNLFSVYLAADDQDESEISFGEWGSPAPFGWSSQG